MSILKMGGSTKGPNDKKAKNPPPKPQDVYYFCNACGTKFKVERADARFCSEICRSAAHSVCKNIITVPHNITEIDAALYDQIIIKLKDDSEIVRKVTFTNDGHGIFTKIKKEMTKTGDEEKDAESQKQEELSEAAGKGKKVEPAPQNDSNLLPGKDLKEQRKLDKKKKKGGDK